MMNRQLSKVALITMALALTACNNNAAVVPPVPSPSASAAATPAPTGTATPAPTGSATPAPTGSASPTGAPTANPGDPTAAKPVVVSGVVYDEKGATVNDALVTIKSLNAAAAYQATATTNAGSWVVNNVPEGVNVEIVVTKGGWTSRRRVGSFQSAASQLNQMNFGSANNAAVDAGSAYYLSDRPEITATEPVHKKEDQDASMLTYKLKLSEPLAEASRKRFEDGIRVFPANSAASPNAAAADQETATDSGALAVDTAYDYVIKKGTTFLGDSSTAATVAWNDDKTEATFTFKAPLITNKSTAAKYQVGLVASSASDPEIEDLQGEQLGTDETGSSSAYPAAGNLIRNVFKESDLAFEGTTTTGDARWNTTHDSIANFRVKKDDVFPKLEGVTVSDIGDDTRIELTFAEPMAAYDDTDGYQHAELTDLSNYSFMIGERASDVAATLEGEASAMNVDPNLPANAIFGDLDADREEEFRLVDGDGDMTDNDDAGDVQVQVDPRNAKVVWITIHGRTDWFDASLAAIKARVEGVGDPAGNTISDSNADKANVVGDL